MNPILKDALECKPTYMTFFSLFYSDKGGMLIFMKGGPEAKSCCAVRNEDVPAVLAHLRKSIKEVEKMYVAPKPAISLVKK